MIEVGQRLNGPFRIIQGVPIPKLLVGDISYTQTPQMLISFLGSQLPIVLNKFNFKHNSI